MEFKKSKLNENLNLPKTGKKSFSKKSQNIIVSESQLERLIEKIAKNKNV
jgi:hypothetical protein